MSNETPAAFDIAKLKAYLQTHAATAGRTGYLMVNRDSKNLRGGPIRVRVAFQNSDQSFQLVDPLSSISSPRSSDTWCSFNATQYLATSNPHLIIADALDRALQRFNIRWELALDRLAHYVDPTGISNQASMAGNLQYFLQVSCLSIQYQSTTSKPVPLSALFPEDILTEMYQAARIEPPNRNRGLDMLFGPPPSSAQVPIE